MGHMLLALVISILAQLCAALPQDSALPTQLPDIVGPTAAPPAACGGCYVVADVAGVVFGTETYTGTITAVQSIGVGLNGSRVTTLLTEGIGQFSFNTGGLIGATQRPGASGNTASTYVLSGATLVSPTAYNVFTAYSVTSAVFTNGACSTFTGPAIQLSGGAFSVPVPVGNGQQPQFVADAESSFIAHIGLPTCSPGGENQSPLTHTPLSVLTEISTTTGSIVFTPQPQVESTSVAITAPKTTPVTTSSVLTATILTPGTVTISSVATATFTTTISAETVVIVQNSSTTTATLTTPVSVVIAGDTTSPIASATAANFTILPYTGSSAIRNLEVGSWWALWGAGILSTIFALFTL